MNVKHVLPAFILILSIANFSSRAIAQAPVKLWDSRFGSNNEDIPDDVMQTPDSGFLFIGVSLSGYYGDKTQSSQGGADYWVVKANQNGVKQWDKSFGGSNDDGAYALETTTDGNYLLGGYSSSDSSGDKTQNSRGNKDYWIVKMTPGGDKIWDSRYGANNTDILRTMKRTSDGGFLLAGYSFSSINGDKTGLNRGPKGTSDFWVIKIDSTGVKQWDRTYGGDGEDELTSMIATRDGGYMLAGSSASNLSGERSQASQGGSDFWILKIDSNGNKLWDARYGGDDDDFLINLTSTSDGGYILDGYSFSGISGNKSEDCWGNSDVWIVKIDSIGGKQWDKRFGGTDMDRSRSIIETQEGGYLAAGYTISQQDGDVSEPSRGGYDFWVIKIATDGRKEWDQRYGGDQDDHAHLVIQQKDGSYILVGHSMSDISGDKTQSCWGVDDFWIIKLVKEVPQFTVSISPIGTITNCKNTSVGFTSSGTNILTYQWYRDGIAVKGATSSTFSTKTGRNIYLRVVFLNGTAINSDTVTLIFNPPPSARIFAANSNADLCNGPVTLNAKNGDNLGYEWQLNDSVIIGATSRIYVPSLAGAYQVRITNTLTECNKLSAPFAVINSCRSNNEIASDDNRFLVYPNPASGTFTINFTSEKKSECEATLKIMNVLGEIFFQESVNMTDGTLEKFIDTRTLPDGPYKISVTSTDFMASTTLIKSE